MDCLITKVSRIPWVAMHERPCGGGVGFEQKALRLFVAVVMSEATA